MENIEINPLVEQFTTFCETPPFSKIKVGDYKPAIILAIDKAKNRVDDIVNSDVESTFSSVIEPLELSSKELDSVTSIFFNMNSAETSDELQAVAIEVSPLLSEFSNSISLNEQLFRKIKSVYENGMTDLNDEQKRVVDKCFKSFERSGANLNADDKISYSKITTELSK